jgi:hypothetical protein
VETFADIGSQIFHVTVDVGCQMARAFVGEMIVEATLELQDWY